MNDEQIKATEFVQLFRPYRITDIELMREKIERYEAALRRLARPGSGFGPARTVARDALGDEYDPEWGAE